MSQADWEAATAAALNTAADLFAEAWAGRSDAERFAAAQPAQPALPVSADAAATEAASRVRRRAALSGAVAPRDLLHDLDPEVGAAVLDVLAPQFDRTLSEGSWVWTLRSGARRDVLTGLVEPEDLQDALEVPTDWAGDTLRVMLATKSTDPAVYRASLPVLLQALTWYAPQGGAAGDLAEVRRVKLLSELRDGYSILTAHGFYGRRAALERLRQFAESRSLPERNVGIPILPVVGIGGSGKSTLIAKYIRSGLDQLIGGDSQAPIIVVIDLDRVIFRVKAQLELHFELTRQLGCALPEAGADFSVLRYQTRRQIRDVGLDTLHGSANSESDAYGVAAFVAAANQIVQMHGLGERPVLLVLDTFEEWQRQRPAVDGFPPGWNQPENQILEWLYSVYYSMGLTGLRVVVSGRAQPSGLGETESPIQMGDLTRRAASSLLRADGIPDRMAATLARAVGGNPLTLRVASRFFLKLPEPERRAFLREGATGAGLSEELRRAVLYKRFLQHIADPQVRRLAHPGLVLRRVTPGLVRHVLAPHCALPALDEAEARELTDRLADEVWLVRATPDGLRHQPDVRRAMLAMMTGDPEHAETMQAIHAAAVAWYVLDDDLSPEAAELEWFYHSLMLDPAGSRSELQAHDWAQDLQNSRLPWTRLAQALGADVADLPLRVRGLVRWLRAEDLSAEEVQALPVQAWSRWVESRGRDLINADNSSAALKLVRSRLALDPSLREPSWLAEACCNCAAWSDYWTLAVPATSRRRNDGSRFSPEVRYEIQDNFLLRVEQRSGLFALLNALCSPTTGDFSTYDEQLELSRERGSGELPLESRIDLAFADLLSRLGAENSPRFGRMTLHPDGWGALGEKRDVDVAATSQLRRALLWLAERPNDDSYVLRKVAGLIRPDPAWADRFALVTEQRELTDYSYSLVADRSDKNSRAGLTSLDPNELALRFARSSRDSIRLNRARLRENPGDLWVLRGDNPELRPAIRLALSRLAAKPEGLVTIGELAADVLPIVPVDLHPRSLPSGSSPEARPALVRLVEYVDRSGVMRPFLERARTDLPRSARLAEVIRAFVLWDDAYVRMLETIGDSLRAERV